jgi:hypothetical protein
VARLETAMIELREWDRLAITIAGKQDRERVCGTCFHCPEIQGGTCHRYVISRALRCSVGVTVCYSLGAFAKLRKAPIAVQKMVVA